MKGEGYKPTAGGDTDKMHQGVKPSREFGRRNDRKKEDHEKVLPNERPIRGSKKPKGSKRKKGGDVIMSGIAEHGFSEKIEQVTSHTTDIDTRGVERYREILRSKGEIMQEDMDQLSRDDAPDTEIEALRNTISNVKRELSEKEELLHQQTVLLSDGFASDKLSPEGKDVFNTLTNEDVQSILHTQGGSPRIIEFLKKGLGYEVVSKNETGDLSFLDKEGRIVLQKKDNAIIKLKPFDLWNLLHHAFEEHTQKQEALALPKKVSDLFEVTDIGHDAKHSALEESFEATDIGNNFEEAEPVTLVEVQEELDALENTSEPIPASYIEADPVLSEDDDNFEDTQDLSEIESNQNDSVDVTTGGSDEGDDVLDTTANELTDKEVFETQSLDDVALEGSYDDEEKFIEAVGRLGLQVISHNGEEYIVQGFMPGAASMPVSRSELISLIQDRSDSHHSQAEVEKDEHGNTLLTPEDLHERFVVPMEARRQKLEDGSGEVAIPPRLEEETDEHGNALLTPEDLHESFVVPMEEERNNFVGPHIPNDLRYERERSIGLPEKEEVSDLSIRPIRERTSPALAHEIQKATERVKELEKAEEAKFFDARFESQFNISEADLESIDGYINLSRGQKKMLLENLTQVTLQNVHDEAKRLCEEHTVQKRIELVDKVSLTLGNALSAFRSALTHTRDIVTTEKEVLKDMKTGGIELHRDVLERLVSGVIKYGPRIHEAENGELIVDLVNIHERATGTLRGKEWFASEELNRAAHAFAKIPASWRGETLGVDDDSEWGVVKFVKERLFTDRKHNRVYREAEEEYTKAKKVLEAVLVSKKNGIGPDPEQKAQNELEVQLMLTNFDLRVSQLQDIQTNPDAIAGLSSIEDKTWWVEMAKNSPFGPGGYMALGFAGRTMLGAAGGYLAAPLVSMGVASLRSWNKSAAELRARDENARAGIENPKIAEARKEIERLEQIDPVSLSGLEKIQLGGLYNLVESELNVESVEDLTFKTQLLLDRYHQAQDPEKGNPEKIPAILAQLRGRVIDTNNKHMQGLINYGRKEESITAKATLMEVMGKSLTLLSMEELASSAYTKERLEKSKRRLSKQQSVTRDMIVAARLAGRSSQMLTSMTIASTFATAGALAAEYYHAVRAGQEAATNALTSGPQTAFKGDVPFVPRPIENGEVNPITGKVLEKSIPQSNVLNELIPRTPGIDTFKSPELDSGTLNNSPRIETEASIQEEIKNLEDHIRVVDDQIEALKTGTYTIKSGDTLTKILNEQVPEIKELSTPEARRAAVAKVLSHLKPTELRAIGIDSEDVNKIRAGDTLNIAKLKEMVGVDLGLSGVSDAVPSDVAGETVRGAMEIAEPVRPGQIRPEFSSTTLPSESITPRAEVTPSATVPNNVVELSPVREAKLAENRMMEVLKIKKAGPTVSGRFFSDIEEYVRSHSREKSEVLTGMRNALRAEEVLSKSKLHLEYRTSETVGEFMKRAGREIAKLSPEARDALLEKMTPKEVVPPREMFTPQAVENVIPTEQPVRPDQVRPGFSENVEAPKPIVQPIVDHEMAPKPPPAFGESGALKETLPPEAIPLGKVSPEFMNTWIKGKIPEREWIKLKGERVGSLGLSQNVYRDPSVSDSTKKLVFIRRMLHQTTGLKMEGRNETIEHYFARGDALIREGKVLPGVRSLDEYWARYEDMGQRMSNPPEYPNQPRSSQGEYVRPAPKYH